MPAKTYEELKQIRDEWRPSVVAEPSWTQGVIWPSLFYAKAEAPAELLTKGVMAWVRIAMANIITSGDTLGWERFINALDRVQRPASYRKAMRLKEQFGIQGNGAAAATNTMVTWARGDLFSDFVHYVVSEHEIKGVGSWCPQVTALEEMGLGDRGQNLKYWCDTYDSMIAHPVNPECRMTHANCPAAGDKFCMFNVFEEKAPQSDSYYKTIRYFNDKKLAELEKDPDPDYFQGFGPPRFHDGLAWADNLKDGMITKASIANQTLIVSGVEYGWKPYLERIMAEHTWGYREEAMKMKRDYGVKGTSVRDAGMLLAIGYGMLGFDDHSIIEFTPAKVEGLADKCPIVWSAEELGLGDKVEDVSLWCDFYHNHKVHAVNEELQVCHTHCLARGDKYCRFCLK